MNTPLWFVRTLAILLTCTVLGCGGDESADSGPRAAAETLTSETIAAKPGTANGTAADSSKGGGTSPVGGRGPDLQLALRNLTSDDPRDRADAVRAFVTAEYNPQAAKKVTDLLVRRLADSEPSTRGIAVAALRVWARPEDVPRIAGLLGRRENDIRHRAIEALGNLGTPEAAVAVADRLPNPFDRERATNGLLAMGTAAETSLLEILEDQEPDAEVRLAIVTVLHDVGTNESFDTLSDLQMDPDPRVAMAAARALDAIESR